MTISTHQQQLIEMFNSHKSWEERYRLIMRMGKTHPSLDAERKVDCALLAGCESTVWFYGHYDQDSRLIQLMIDSDAKIIRGLIAIILSAHQDLTFEQVHNFDCAKFIENLGLFSHLSPSRGNGIKAIINAIQEIRPKLVG